MENVAHVGGNPDLRVFLIHGELDDAIPAEVSADFAEVLTAAGYEVTLAVVEKAFHDTPVLPVTGAGQVTVDAVVQAAQS